MKLNVKEVMIGVFVAVAIAVFVYVTLSAGGYDLYGRMFDFFRDPYIRFMVWLGAEPPSGYEHPLKKKPAHPSKPQPLQLTTQKPIARQDRSL